MQIVSKNIRFQNLHTIIIFKIKNVDLGFAPPAVVAEVEVQDEQPAPANLVADNYVFLQFNSIGV